MNDPIYAIGDIHGHLDQLKRVHSLIEQDQADIGLNNAPIVHIGDLTDRGPDSRGVIDHLIDGRADDRNWIVIKGNHDRFFQMIVQDPDWKDVRLRPELSWIHPRMGGLATLASYGIDTTTERTWHDLAAEAQIKVPPAHTEFIRNLPIFHEHGELYFAHAGIRPTVPLNEQIEQDLIWIREGFLDHTDSFGPLVVHGHTMVDQVELHSNRLNIDTGAGRGDDLTAVVIEGRQAWVLGEDGRRLVSPQPTA